MAKRPDNTYVSQVFNFGIDKNIPLGFVNVVYSKQNGSALGYEKDGKFYTMGEKVPEKVTETEKRKTYSGSLEEQIRIKEKEMQENKKAKSEADLRAETSAQRRATTAQGDVLDKYATTLKPQMDDYQFQIEAYARKIARGDKLSPVEEKELKRISASYASIKKTYNEARSDALDLYYGKQTQATTPTGKKVVSTTTPSKTVTGPTGPAVTPKITAGAKTTPTPVVTPTPKVTPTSKVTPTPVVPTPVTPTPKVTTPVTPTPSGPTGPVAGVSGPSVPAIGTYDSILAKAKTDYNLPDIIFSNVTSLGNILKEYVDGKIDIELFKQKVANDTWYRQNSGEIKARYLQKFNYQDLVKSGQAKGTTDYEMQIAEITRNLQSQARQMGSALDEGQAKLIAEDLYIHNQDADESIVARRLASGIRPVAGMIAGKITEDYSGQALANYQGLQALAKRNGFRIEDILPRGADGKPATAQSTLQQLALGELDPTRLAQDVRKLAAIGQPQFVRDLLGQGIDLEEIYAPYKKTMANVLELDQGQIDLTDPTLRMGINEKGDMNLFDYSKALRKDTRWQYTGDAREKVSEGALTVLRNFGFQG